jgi:hypothetical protein
VANRRGGSRAEPGAWACRLAGAGLLSTPVLVLAALTLTPVVGEDTAEFLLLMAPCGLLPAVAVRSFRVAAGRGGGPRHLLAALVTVFTGTGPGR